MNNAAMTRSGRLLLVENDVKDMKLAAAAAERAGFSGIEGKTTPQAARIYLENLLDSGKGLPDAIVLDLDFGYESGYELLRFWHSHPGLRCIPVIVWSVLGDDQREMCRFFKVKQFVGKWEGNEVLQDALQQILAS